MLMFQRPKTWRFKAMVFGITCSAQCTPGGINAFINDKLSDESIYEDVDKLMKADLHTNKITGLKCLKLLMLRHDLS